MPRLARTDAGKPSLDDLRQLARATSRGLYSFEIEPNGAVYVRAYGCERAPDAAREHLATLRDAYGKRWGFYAVLDVSASTDGVPRPGYPRLALHPSNVRGL